MSDAKDILESILNDEKLLKSRAFRDKVYSDEPILKTASQLKKPKTPEKIKAMKAMAYTPEAYWKTSAWLFYKQGKFMEDFEDVYEYNEDFVRYYPAYRDFTIEQLRGFFSWRSKVRRGQFPDTPLPYVYLLAYEIINGIGVKKPEDGIFMLKNLSDHYGTRFPGVKKYLGKWMLHYAVYNELPAEMAESEENDNDSALITLLHWEDKADNELFPALVRLSSYAIEESGFYMQYPEDFREAACRCWRMLAEIYRSKRKNSLFVNWFGKPRESQVVLFDSAIFYNRKTDCDRKYIINEINEYERRNGQWFCCKFQENRGRSIKLGAFMKALDGAMRKNYNYKYKLKVGEIAKVQLEIIRSVLETIRQEKEKEKVKKIEIDVSLLSGIRRSSDITRDKLIVDEEELAEIYQQEEPVQEQAEQLPEPENSTPLDRNELMFLRSLLNGEDSRCAAKNAGILPSILADSINEKLFDIFGDTVIAFNGDDPELIGDYIDELNEMLKGAGT